MVSLSAVLEAVAENMENSGIDCGEAEAAVFNLKYNVREKNKVLSATNEPRDLRIPLDKTATNDV